MEVLALILLIFVLVVCLCFVFGLKIMAAGAKTSGPPAIPPAVAVKGEGIDPAGAAATRRAEVAERKMARGAAVTFGLGVILAPWLFALWAIDSLSKMDFTKGRVLRIRNRAQLPALSRGDGWSGDPVALERALTPHERRLLGELWLLAARMEHASVPAFSQLGLHLAALGAPSHLVEATHRAALDEIRHARACFAIARAISGEPHTAGPIAALAQPAPAAVDLTRLAIGSLVDGCLAEGIAADVAGHGARSAEEPAIRAALEMIARDEAGHAELAWDVLAWCLGEGGPALARALETRVARLDRELEPRLPDLPGLDAAAVARHGIVDQGALGDLARARIAAVQERARRLLADATPALAA